MKKYESIVILDEKINEEGLNEFKDYLTTIVEYNGEDIGIKQLAYEIKGHKKGHFYKIEFEGNENIVEKLERYYRIKEEVLKFITIRKEV